MAISIKNKAKKDYGQDYTTIYPFIVQIGTGGTGGYLVQHIAQLLGTSKSSGTYVIVDPDVIEEKNLGNQLFLPSEVGLKKADVLASRYSAAYGFPIGSYSDRFIEDAEHLKCLFSVEYMSTPPSDHRERVLLLPILIGCVDNNFTRQVMHEFFTLSSHCIYIDAGNESTVVPSDWMRRPKQQWSEQELQAFNDSGWTGQVVTGVKLNLFKQGAVADEFPDILTDTDSIRPSELSCTELTASEPQRLIVNKFAALAITNVVTQIVEEHTLDSHIVFFHAKECYMRKTPVQEEQT